MPKKKKNGGAAASASESTGDDCLLDAAIAANKQLEMLDLCGGGRDDEEESPAALLLSAVRAHGSAGSNMNADLDDEPSWDFIKTRTVGSSPYLDYEREPDFHSVSIMRRPWELPPEHPASDASVKANAGAKASTKDGGEDGEDGRSSASSRRKPRGDTPLHAACSGGHPSIVKQLVESGANINAWSNSDGNSPAMRALEDGKGKSADRQLQCVRLLVEAGCDMQQANFAGNVLLHIALEYKADAICDYLIRMGAKGCIIQGRKCRKCEMGIKLRSRAIAKQPQQTASSSKEDTAKVLEEEFGGDDGDFMKALESAKLEMRRESGM